MTFESISFSFCHLKHWPKCTLQQGCDRFHIVFHVIQKRQEFFLQADLNICPYFTCGILERMGINLEICLNSLAPGGFDYSLKLVNFKLISTINKYSLLMHCIKIKSPVNFYWMSNMFLWVEIFLFFVCYHVVPERHSQLDYELNGL